jgi:hypothetical protein
MRERVRTAVVVLYYRWLGQAQIVQLDEALLSAHGHTHATRLLKPQRCDAGPTTGALLHSGPDPYVRNILGAYDNTADVSCATCQQQSTLEQHANINALGLSSMPPSNKA